MPDRNQKHKNGLGNVHFVVLEPWERALHGLCSVGTGPHHRAALHIFLPQVGSAGR
jgi:hypothetical protein